MSRAKPSQATIRISARHAADEEFAFAQLSDPHLSSLEGVHPHQLLSQRILGYLSWHHRRREEHRPEVLAALLADLQHTRPAHVVITGDLTHIGLAQEFRQVRDWLNGVGNPTEITVIPGNHDAYVATPWAQSLGCWAPYMSSDTEGGRQPAAHTAFPTLRVRGPVALIGLSSACPSPPFFATGTIGQPQLRRLEQILAETRARELFRVVLVHHPPLAKRSYWRKRLTDAAALCRVLARAGAELVLHGHTHRATNLTLQTTHGSIPVIAVPSASTIDSRPARRASYNLYRLTRTPTSWALQICTRTFAADTARFVDAGAQELRLPFA